MRSKFIGIHSPLPKEKTYVDQISKKEIDGLIISELIPIEQSSIDNRAKLDANDFRLDILLANGSLDLLKNHVSISSSNLESNDSFDEGLSNLEQISNPS